MSVFLWACLAALGKTALATQQHFLKSMSVMLQKSSTGWKTFTGVCGWNTWFPQIITLRGLSRSSEGYGNTTVGHYESKSGTVRDVFFFLDTVHSTQNSSWHRLKLAVAAYDSVGRLQLVFRGNIWSRLSAESMQTGDGFLLQVSCCRKVYLYVSWHNSLF